MSSDAVNSKPALRQRCRALRRELGQETRQRASQAICAHLAAWQVFQRAETILTYMPMKAEVDLRPLLEQFPAKRWLLPRIVPEEEHRMDFHLYDPARLVLHPFGMAEPAADLPVVAATEIELVLVPGLAYDRLGWRLGYGGGYYDRFLARFNGISVGVTYQALLLEAVPHGEHDVPVGWIVTENGILQSQPA
ncbi:MAG: 5-formyltetrahydrofolate cyclo-ligase [Anaerolineae bacterium]|nr:MAG: 5-formyltetrahydrofolate cyclo-ligase [Anaerolineae bacterium]